MKKGIVSILISLFCCLTAAAQADTIFISSLYTTHIVFTTDISYTDLSNTSVIVANVVEKNKNMLAIMAWEDFYPLTASLTVLESNGEIHPYILAYKAHPDKLIYDTRSNSTRGLANAPGQGSGTPAINAKNGNVSNLRKEDAPDLESVNQLSQNLFHIAARSGRIEFVCENIFSYSDITYVTLTLKNNSGVSYETENASFVIESRNKGKRKVISEQPIFPKNRFGSLTTPAKSKSRITYSLDKLTLAPDQVLRIYLYEESGRRNLILTLSPDDVNLAKIPKK